MAAHEKDQAGKMRTKKGEWSTLETSLSSDLKVQFAYVPVLEPSTNLPTILGLLRLPGSEVAEQTVAP